MRHSLSDFHRKANQALAAREPRSVRPKEGAAPSPSAAPLLSVGLTDRD
jgi:hypothetical protein